MIQTNSHVRTTDTSTSFSWNARVFIFLIYRFKKFRTHANQRGILAVHLTFEEERELLRKASTSGDKNDSFGRRRLDIVKYPPSSLFLVTRPQLLCHLNELTCQAIPVVMRISLLIKAIQPDQSNPNSMHEWKRFSLRTLGKSLFHLQNDRSGNSLRASSPIWASDACLARTGERGPVLTFEKSPSVR